jgi:hypothetical protein
MPAETLMWRDGITVQAGALSTADSTMRGGRSRMARSAGGRDHPYSFRPPHYHYQPPSSSSPFRHRADRLAVLISRARGLAKRAPLEGQTADGAISLTVASDPVLHHRRRPPPLPLPYPNPSSSPRKQIPQVECLDDRPLKCPSDLVKSFWMDVFWKECFVSCGGPPPNPTF